MQSFLLWPQNPILSGAVIWLVSVVLLWAARAPMLDLLRRLGEGLDEGLGAAARACTAAAHGLRERSRAALLAAGSLELGHKLDREFHGIDRGFSEKLEQYANLHRRLDDVLQELDDDYRKCGDNPPQVPGWTTAAQAIAKIPSSSDPNVHKVLESIRKSSGDAEKKTLAAYRDATAHRHKLLGSMGAAWKEVRSLMARMQDAVTRAMETTTRIDGYVEEFRAIRDDEERAARARAYSATKLFVVSVVVLAIALGGAFVNFQLIALPMSELVPAGARIGGVPVATVSALVIVLMEAAVGIFVMDMLGITELFPKLAGIPSSRRRLILWLGLAALFFLASVESSLAILREQIAEADSALKLALAGETGRLVTEASSSRIPVVGQAVLGFVLPWVLSMVAVPLEMLLDSGRFVLASLAVIALHALGQLAHTCGRIAAHASAVLASLYDVYIALPLRLESWIHSRRAGDDGPARGAPLRAEGASKRVAGEGVA
jgi:ADP-ribose pyrophosphatase YjhB (NUDIX family)